MSLNADKKLAQQAAEKIEVEQNSKKSLYCSLPASQLATLIANTYEPVLKERDEVIKVLKDALTEIQSATTKPEPMWRNAASLIIQVKRISRQALTRAEAILNQKNKGE